VAITVPVIATYNGRQLKTAVSDLESFKKAAQRAGGGIGGYMDAAGQAIAGVGRQTAEVGASLSRNVTLPLVGVAAASVRLQADFETSMNTLQVAANASGTEVKKLSDLAKQLGADTSFSAGEAANAMVDLAKAGFTPAQIAGGGVQATMALAAAEGMALADAANTTAQAMGAFGLKAAQASKVADALAGGSMSSTASVASLSEALAQVGPGAKNAGLNLNDTVGVLAAFAQNGIKGSDAGTSLKTMLSRLVPQTDAARAAMRKYGLEFVNADGSFKSVTQIAGQLQRGLGGLSEAQRTSALATIFGSDATRAATVLMNEGSKGVHGFIKATYEQGAAQKLADARTKGTAGALERMKGSLETAGLAIGEALAPHVVALADKVGALADKFSQLDPSTQKVIVSIGAAVAAIGPALFVVGKLTTAVGSTISTLSGTVKGASNFVKGVRSAEAAASKASGVMGTLGGATSKAFAGMKTATVAAASGIKTALVATGQAAAAMGRAVAGAMLSAARAVGMAMLTIGRALMANPWILAVAAVIAAVVLIIKNWDKVKAVLLAVWSKISEAATKTFSAIKNTVTSAVSAVVGFVRKNWPLLLTIVLGPLGAIIAAVIKNWAQIKGAVTAGVKAVGAAIRSAWNAVASLTSKVWQGIKNTVSGVWETFKSVGQNVARGLWEGIQSMKDWVKDKVLAWVKAILPGPVEKALGIASPSKLFIYYGKMVGAGLVEGLRKSEGSAAAASRALASAAIDAARDKLAGFKDQARQVVDMARSIQADLRGGAGLGNLLNGDAPVTADGVRSYLKERLALFQALAGKVSRLRKAGLPNAFLQDVISAGPDGGNKLADALLAGGAGFFGQLRSLDRQLNATAGAIGATGAQSQFGQSVASARGVLASNVTVQRGGIVVNFGDNVSAQDRAAISRAVEESVDAAFDRLLREVRR